MPTDWTTLGNLVAEGTLELSDGYRTKQSELGLPGVPILRVAEVLDGKIAPSYKDYVRLELRPAFHRKTSRTDDVVLTTKGTVGRVARVPSDAPEFVYSPQLCFFRAVDGDRLDSNWLYYWFQGSEFRIQALRVQDQTDMAPYINLVDLRRIRILLPPLAEQRSIAYVLGALDDKIEANDRLSNLVLRLAVARYERAVLGSAYMNELGALGKWLSGGTPSTSNTDYWGGNIPWISSGSLKSFFVAVSDRNVTEAGAQAGTRVVPSGSVLFVVRGMSLKTAFRVGIAQREVAFGQDCKAILVHEQFPPTTVAVALLTRRDEVLTLVDEAGHGTGRLPTDRLERFQVQLPRPEEVTAVEGLLSSLVQRGAAAEAENRRLAKLRDAMLPHLLSGELRVQDAERTVGEAV